MHNGYYVIDADGVARLVMSKGTPCLNEVVATFGSEILEEDGNLNRKALADIVFTSKPQLEKLNAITYPHIVSRIQSMVENTIAVSSNKILIDAPTLFESGCDKLCTCIVSVLAPKPLRLDRIVARDGITVQQAEHRIASQLSEDYFRKHSNYTIQNDTSKEILIRKTLEVIEKINKY
jgi:dephospho-CoA kinase